MPITKDTPLADIIHDFVHSDVPKFAGKSKEERIKQAKGAFYGMQKEGLDESLNSFNDTKKTATYWKAHNHGFNGNWQNTHKHGTKIHAEYEAGYKADADNYKESSANVASHKANESIELIDAIAEGDTIAASNLFSELLMSRVSSLIEERRKEVAQGMFAESNTIKVAIANISLAHDGNNIEVELHRKHQGKTHVLDARDTEVQD